MSDIFISHSKEDHKTAGVFAQAFESEGWSVWFHIRIEAGASWDKVLDEELIAARAVVVLWSSHSVKSMWVRNEARFANRKAILLPVIIEKVEPPIEFNNIQYEDMCDWKGDSSQPRFRNFSRAIARKIGGPSGKKPWFRKLSRAIAHRIGGSSEKKTSEARRRRAHSKVRETARCPKCGFYYGWNGHSCSHCGHSREN